MALIFPETHHSEPAAVGVHAPRRNLSPVSINAMSAVKGTKTPSSLSPSKSYTNSPTIRSVPTEPLSFEASLEDNRRQQGRNEFLVSPHSARSDFQNVMINSPSKTANTLSMSRQNLALAGVNGKTIHRQVSSEFGPTVSYTNSPNNSNFSNGSLVSPHSPHSSISLVPEENNTASHNGGTPWNSAVGRASLGKSGRVIERLMGENDMLKRDLNIERLRAEESKQAVKMTESRMEALTADYDSKLHDAAITKTLLKRRERQLADLRLQVETEKARADLAIESEMTWREQIEQVQEETKRQVEEAQNMAAMMEGRNNAMASHWKEQGAEFDRAVAKLNKEIQTIILARKEDDERINTLQCLCDQQAQQLKLIMEERDAIYRKHEEYKCFQDASLMEIKKKARDNEENGQLLLEETKKVMGEMKWALAVKKNVSGLD